MRKIKKKAYKLRIYIVFKPFHWKLLIFYLSRVQPFTSLCHWQLWRSNDKISTFFTDPPIMSIRPGRSIDLDRIQENVDVYFECVIDANPPVSKINFYHQVRQKNSITNKMLANINNNWKYRNKIFYKIFSPHNRFLKKKFAEMEMRKLFLLPRRKKLTAKNVNDRKNCWLSTKASVIVSLGANGYCV